MKSTLAHVSWRSPLKASLNFLALSLVTGPTRTSDGSYDGWIASTDPEIIIENWVTVDTELVTKKWVTTDIWNWQRQLIHSWRLESSWKTESRLTHGIVRENRVTADTIKRLMSYPKCRSVEVINNPARSGSNHR